MSLGAVFSIFAAFYYWIGKMSGRQYPELAGKIHFWITFIGVNMVFFPQHFLGMQGMPRRYIDYPDEFAFFNKISSYGSYVTAVGVVLFLGIVIYTFTKGKKCADNPWGSGADTLEWTLPSPPPFHQFEELPVIK